MGFNILELNALFIEFQFLKQLIAKEPYRSLLTTYPQAITKIKELADKMLRKETITEDDLKLLFDPASYEETVHKKDV